MTGNASASIQFGAMTIPYLRWPFRRALEGIARAGFDYVGIRPGHADGPLLPDQPTREDFRAVRQTIESHGLTPVQMFARRPTGDPAESLRRDVDTIVELGIPQLLVIPVSPAPGFSAHRIGAMEWFTRVEAWFKMLGPAVRRAERRGVTLVLKPHGGIAGTGDDLAQIVERIGSPAVRVTYDPGNVAYYEGVRPETDLPAVADLVAAVCIKDHRGGRAVEDFPTPGDGDIDHEAIFQTLHGAGFAGPCLIERIDNLDTPEAVDRELARGRAYLLRIAARAMQVNGGEQQ